jgi:hypothetical protein
VLEISEAACRVNGDLRCAVEKLRAYVDRFLFALWAGPLFIGLNLWSGNNSKRVAESLLDQTRFNSCVREGVSTFRTFYNPACHRKPVYNVGCMNG